MPPAARPRHHPTDDWSQLRLLVASPAQETYELLRPIVLFGQPPAARARKTGVPERTLRRKAARFDAHGMRSLFALDPLAYFIRRAARVAEEEGGLIGIHPDDPPIPRLGGVPRIFSTFENYKRALEIADSPNVGVCLCVGCWLEGGEMWGVDAVEAIRYFGARQQLFKVHFRNVDAPLPEFFETFVDDGYGDMYAIMRALQEVGFRGVAIPDHIPLMGDDPRLGTAFTIGYMKALLDRAQAEVDGR